MAIGKRTKRQGELWIPTQELPTPISHPFYSKVNEILAKHGFDAFVEGMVLKFYHASLGRPSIPPGNYFRLLLLGYFEGIDSERGIAWRVSDSLALRSFLGLALTDNTPDHSSMSRIRTRIDVETHEAVFTWALRVLAQEKILVGSNVGIDATTLEANAAMRGIVRRDTGATYQEFLKALAQASGIETPTKEDLIRLDRDRKKKTSNKEWKSPVDPDSRVAKMKDGSTHLAHKVEHAVDLDSGAVVGVTIQGADLGDTTTVHNTTRDALALLADATRGLDEIDRSGLMSTVVGDKGYHSSSAVLELQEFGIVPVISEPDRGRRKWAGKEEEQKAVYANRQRLKCKKGKKLLRQRAEFVERSFAHCYETGGMRHVFLRGHENILKRLLIHIAGFNLGILLRKILGKGTPRGFGDLVARLRKAFLALFDVHARTSSKPNDLGWISFLEGLLQGLFWILTMGTQIGDLEENSGMVHQSCSAP